MIMEHRKEEQLEKKHRKNNPESTPRCGLCGKAGSLTLTDCCNNWICDDAERYVIFSYERNSCFLNHTKYSLCSYHHNEGHEGDWKVCQKCRDDFNTEMYAWYGTNEHNFEKLGDPPEYEPTRCVKCRKIINLGEDGYGMSGGKYLCEKCMGFEL